MGEYSKRSPKDQTALYYAINDNGWEEEERIFRLNYNQLIIVPNVYDLSDNDTLYSLFTVSQAPFLHLALSGWSKYDVAGTVDLLSNSLGIPSERLRFLLDARD